MCIVVITGFIVFPGSNCPVRVKMSFPTLLLRAEADFAIERGRKMSSNKLTVKDSDSEIEEEVSETKETYARGQ